MIFGLWCKITGLVDGQRYSLSFHLDCPDLWQGSLVHIGSALAKVVVRCPEGYHSSEVSLQVIPEVTLTATVFLGMDWLLAYLTATQFVKGTMCFCHQIFDAQFCVRFTFV